MSDINIGQITEALNDKMDRDAHNVQSPSAVVVEKQDPTAANNYTWYRKYSDGWVEQGGAITSYSTGGWQAGITINLPIAMADNKYCVSWMNGWDTYTGEATAVTYKATTSFNISLFTSRSDTCAASWQVSGQSAN